MLGMMGIIIYKCKGDVVKACQLFVVVYFLYLPMRLLIWILRQMEDTFMHLRSESNDPDEQVQLYRDRGECLGHRMKLQEHVDKIHKALS